MNDGRVMIAGGEGTLVSDLNSVELYNSSTGSWGYTTPLNTPRRHPAAIGLQNGKVLVTGGARGLPTNNRYLSSTEIYDPVTKQWTYSGNLNVRREGDISAVLLKNGKVLLAGGYYLDALINKAEIYDPNTGIWTVSQMPYAWSRAAMTVLNNGKVLIAGGGTPSGITAQAMLYDPDTNTWTATGSMHIARVGYAVLLTDGKVLVIGGGTKSTEIYDPVTGQWTISGETHQASHNGITVLQNGDILAVGGDPDGLTAELFTEPSPTPTPTITIISPNGGENWQAGSSQNIKWSYTENPGSNVQIELLKGGVIDATITSSTPIGSSGSGSYAWTIPSTQKAGIDYQIRITSTTNNAYADTSDGYFVICQISPSGLNSCDLQKGDILFLHALNPLSVTEATLFAGYWSHAGIYNGDGNITESYPYYPNGNPFDGFNLIDTPGVVVNPLAKSLFWNKDVDDWAVLRVNSLSPTQQGNAVAYAEGRADENHLYNYDFPDKLTETKFYCSQLVWRAYYNQGVDLDSNLSSFGLLAKYWLTPLGVIGQPLIASAVPPDDIYFSPYVTKVEEKPGISSSVGRWVFRLLSPANMLVTDPQGRRAGYDPATNSILQEIPDTFYSGTNTEPQHIDVRGLVSGIWTFQITGTGTGPYTFLAESIDKDSHMTISAPGTITPGSIVTYQFSNPGNGNPPVLTQIVNIDIKPGEDPAAVNPDSQGVTPVALLSSLTFDATTVNPSTVKFGQSGATRSQNSTEDVDSDGTPDLVLHFPTQQTGIKAGDTQACLTGKTKAGINIQGCDTIHTVNN